MSTADPHLFVILGATGDLTARKLLPALYRLVHESPAKTVVVGAATSDLDDDGFRTMACRALTETGVDHDEATAWSEDSPRFQFLILQPWVLAQVVPPEKR